jgi:hypothetical protein
VNVPCSFCGEPVDPLDRATYRRIVGWERKAFAASRKSGSDIVLREPRDEFAHPGCILRVQDGIDIGQVSFL